ncbi:Xaa-Pro aminopeptidase [Aequorivita sublithincola DSM 14238]|uniref:Xaa-Pro aminopeptidase n=1 Tax=Aequorivita sublithincola (strain DSM 14238 / LMG 21431 / ACAM 643 / 9-3) TaxID=746697 RepID=I3YYR2_AEQSU|nr:aminopeptidase P family protein [Aequorivita sublithincola]AFL82130.1 Xaa-Pro aminopeptidase [Aequorivita sublithincola DSM 14238]
MINKRLEKLRQIMTKYNFDAIIIPSTDPHQSEYVAKHWKVREYFSGFTGSAGVLVVMKDETALWTDSRYFLQFEDECKDYDVNLHKQSIPHAPEHVQWLCDTLAENAVIGLDFLQFSKAQMDYIKEVSASKNIQLKNTPNLVNEIWADRPALPAFPVDIHPLEYSGETTASKIKKVQNKISTAKADYYLFSSLDEIAWLFNIRSKDVDFTPLVTAYALVGLENTVLFCDSNRFSATAIETFSKLNIEIIDYELAIAELQKLDIDKKIITDISSLNYAVYNAVQSKFLFQNSIAKELKSIKNETEISGAKNCMLKDGVALTKFFIWLENELPTREISEYEIGKKLESFRKQQDLYVGESFAAIVGYKGNGAIIHYTASEERAALVKNENILLVDSGAQYKDGTTDITRTVWLGGTPTAELKTAYTSVLKGYIALEQLQFPKGTVGMQIDAFARFHLWQHGLNYPHGTGHGIGSFGMVHESPQGFTTNPATSSGRTSHLPNQLTTIEPGCYKKGVYGIRIENIVLSIAKQETEFGNFLGFTPITLCAIDRQLIDKSLLTDSEIAWFNSYHKMVYDKLSPMLNSDEKKWLQRMCEEL